MGGDDFLDVELDGSNVIVLTFWVDQATHDDPIGDGDEDARIPSKARLARVCRAVKALDPSVSVQVAMSGPQDILTSCRKSELRE